MICLLTQRDSNRLLEVRCKFRICRLMTESDTTESILTEAEKLFHFGDYPESYRLFQKLQKLLPDDGHIDYRIGMFYMEGHAVPKDVDKAAHYFDLAKEKFSKQEENSQMLSDIGCLYFYGYQYQKDPYKAYDYWNRSAKLGNPNAIFNLAYLFHKGLGVTQDESKAFQYYIEAASKGSTRAYYQIASRYEEGLGCNPDMEKALEYYNIAADKGDTISLISLGIKYHNGDGVAIDYDKAIEYYDRAAALKNSDGYYNLGVIYENMGDFQKSAEYFELAAEHGDIEAKLKLAVSWNEGFKIEKNILKSFNYFYSVLKIKATEDLEPYLRDRGVSIDELESNIRTSMESQVPFIVDHFWPLIRSIYFLEVPVDVIKYIFSILVFNNMVFDRN